MFIPKQKNKNLTDFLKQLVDLIEANLEFIREGETNYEVDYAYKEELIKIQDMIDSFKFE